MRTHNLLKISVLSLSLILIVALMFPSPAHAEGITVKDTVKEGEVVDHNMVLSGPVVRMDGKIEGDLLAVGDQIKINGEVDGNLLVIGNQVVLNGPVSGSIYIGAATLVVGPQASVGRDVSFIGGMFETNETSAIKRDLNIISLDSKLAGETGRDVNALVGPLRLGMVIYNFIKDQGWLPQSTGFDSGNVSSQSAGQSLLANGLTLHSIQPLVLIASPASELGIQPPRQASGTNTEQWQAWGIALLRNIAALLIVGLLSVWLIPAQLTFSSEQPRRKPWRSLLVGFLILLLGWFLALLALLLVIGLAFFFFWISLPNLGFLVGSLGVMAVGLASIIYWLSIAYFSKVIIAFLLGRTIFSRSTSKYAQGRVLPLIVGVVLFALIVSIPYLGGVVSVIATMFGLGALWMVAFPEKVKEPEAVTVVQPAEADLGLSSGS
jgi:cytoskeletal protein CcmA (bactofilin family)